MGSAHGSIGDGYELQHIQCITNSDGQPPSVSAGMIEVFSLTCSHTNAALRVGGSDLLFDDPTICFNGRVPQPNFVELDASLVDAMRNGTPKPWSSSRKQIMCRWQSPLQTAQSR